MSLMTIKHVILKALKGALFENITKAKQSFAKLEKHFVKSDKVETSTLLQHLISMKYKSKEIIREYIIKMSHIVVELKELKLELFENLLVHLVLISLLVQYSQFKVSYNCQKEKWTLNGIIYYLM